MASPASCLAVCHITSLSAPWPPVPLVWLVVVSPCCLHCGVDVYSCIVVICIFACRLRCSPLSGPWRRRLRAASLSTLSSIVCVAASSSALTSALSSASLSAAPSSASLLSAQSMQIACVTFRNGAAKRIDAAFSARFLRSLSIIDMVRINNLEGAGICG
jgi:hypothetical protein